MNKDYQLVTAIITGTKESKIDWKMANSKIVEAVNQHNNRISSPDRFQKGYYALMGNHIIILVYEKRLLDNSNNNNSISVNPVLYIADDSYLINNEYNITMFEDSTIIHRLMELVDRKIKRSDEVADDIIRILNTIK